MARNALTSDKDPDFAVMDEAYRGYFTEPYPARTTIGVAALPLGAAVEMVVVVV